MDDSCAPLPWRRKLEIESVRSWNGKLSFGLLVFLQNVPLPSTHIIIKSYIPLHSFVHPSSRRRREIKYKSKRAITIISHKTPTAQREGVTFCLPKLHQLFSHLRHHPLYGCLCLSCPSGTLTHDLNSSFVFTFDWAFLPLRPLVYSRRVIKLVLLFDYKFTAFDLDRSMPGRKKKKKNSCNKIKYAPYRIPRQANDRWLNCLGGD